MSFGWHPREHRAALYGMLMLSLEERGAYNTLLDLIYERAGPIPDDDRWLSGWMGVSLRRWSTIRASLILKGKVYELNFNGTPSLMNQRAALEIENQAKLSRNLSESGAKGGRKRAENSSQTNKNNDLDQATLEAPLKLKTKTLTEELEAKASLSPEGDDDPAKSTPPANYPEPFEAAWKAYPHVKGRSSKPKALGFWRRLDPDARQRLPNAAARYAKHGREPRMDCGAQGMHLWIRDAKFADWMEDDTPAHPPADPSPTIVAQRRRHLLDTGEWRDAWGPKPLDDAA